MSKLELNDPNANRSKVREREDSPSKNHSTKKMKRDTSCPIEVRAENSAVSVWQYTSSSRCISHGKLDCQKCLCTKLDPQQRKMRIESVNMTTPYERAKNEKMLFELQNKEVKHRVSIQESFKQFCEAAVEVKRIILQISQLYNEEETGRMQIKKDEYKIRSSWGAVLDLEKAMLALLQAERESRKSLFTLEYTQRHTIEEQFQAEVSFSRLIQREQVTRRTIEYNENAVWNSLFSSMMQEKKHQETHINEQRALWAMAVSSKETLVRNWEKSLQEIEELAIQERKWMDSHMSARIQLFVQCEKYADELYNEAVHKLQGMKVEMQEEEEMLREKLEVFSRLFATLLSEETMSRRRIMDEVGVEVNALYHMMRDSENLVREIEGQKLNTLKQFSLEAVEYLFRIVSEEEGAWTQLMELEIKERRGREEWMVEKANAQYNFQKKCLQKKQEICEMESSEFREILYQMDKNEQLLEERKHWLERCSNELLLQCVSEKQEIKVEEHAQRFQLISHKAQKEELIAQWNRMNAKEIEDLVNEESIERMNVDTKEEIAREQILYVARQNVDNIHSTVQRRGERLQQFQDAALSALEVIVEGEKYEFGGIIQKFIVELDGVYLKKRFREQLIFSQTESETRSGLIHEETLARVILEDQKRLVQQVFEEEKMRRWKHFCEVVEMLYKDEEKARQDLQSNERALFANLLQTESDERKELNGYNLDETYVFKKQFLLETLGVPMNASEVLVSPEGIDNILSIVDTSDCTSRRLMENSKIAQRKVKEAKKKLSNLEESFKSELEKKDDVLSRLHREEEDFKKRLDMENDRKMRESAQIDVERRKLSETEQQLKQQEDLLNSLKDRIHKRLNRK